MSLRECSFICLDSPLEAAMFFNSIECNVTYKSRLHDVAEDSMTGVIRNLFFFVHIQMMFQVVHCENMAVKKDDIGINKMYIFIICDTRRKTRSDRNYALISISRQKCQCSASFYEFKEY